MSLILNKLSDEHKDAQYDHLQTGLPYHFCIFVSCSSISLPLCVPLCLSHERLDRDSTFFPRLTYTNVLMDRGDKENEGEEGRTVRPTHSHTENSLGRQICGHLAHLSWERGSWRWHMSEREREERGGEGGCRQENYQREGRGALVGRIGW